MLLLLCLVVVLSLLWGLRLTGGLGFLCCCHFAVPACPPVLLPSLAGSGACFGSAGSGSSSVPLACCGPCFLWSTLVPVSWSALVPISWSALVLVSFACSDLCFSFLFLRPALVPAFWSVMVTASPSCFLGSSLVPVLWSTLVPVSLLFLRSALATGAVLFLTVAMAVLLLFRSFLSVSFVFMNTCDRVGCSVVGGMLCGVVWVGCCVRYYYATVITVCHVYI